MGLASILVASLIYSILCLAYLGILRAVIVSQSAAVGVLVGLQYRISSRIHRREIAHKLARAELAVGALLATLGVSLAMLEYSGFQVFVRFWESPIGISAVLFSLLILGKAGSSLNPHYRALANFSYVSGWIVAVATVSFFFAPSLVQGRNLDAPLLGAGVLFLILTMLAGNVPKSIASHELLSARHAALAEPEQRWKVVAEAVKLGSATDPVVETFNQMVVSRDAAVDQLRVGQYDDAERALQQAEFAARHLDRMSQDAAGARLAARFQPACDELSRRLSAVAARVAASGIVLPDLEKDAAMLAQIQRRLATAEISVQALAEIAESFIQASGRITRVGEAMQLGENANLALASLKHELSELETIMEVAVRLDIPRQDSPDGREQLTPDFASFERNDFQTSEEILRAYSQIVGRVRHLRTVAGALEGQRRKSFFELLVQEAGVRAYVPKTISVNHPRPIAVVGESGGERTEVSFDGALLELPASGGKLTFERGASVQSFSIAGKRAGTATISMVVKRGGEQHECSVVVETVASVSQLATTSLVWSTVLGAAVAVVFVILGVLIEAAIAWGTVSGAGLAFVLFVVRIYRRRRALGPRGIRGRGPPISSARIKKLPGPML